MVSVSEDNVKETEIFYVKNCLIFMILTIIILCKPKKQNGIILAGKIISVTIVVSKSTIIGHLLA